MAWINVDAVDAPATVLARVVVALIDIDLALGAGVTSDARALIIVLFVDTCCAVQARPWFTFIDIGLENVSQIQGHSSQLSDVVKLSYGNYSDHYKNVYNKSQYRPRGADKHVDIAENEEA